MEKKIVGGAKAEAGGTKAPIKAGGESAPAGEADLTFKAKREKNKQLKNKKMLKQVENEQRQQQEEEMLLADDINEREENEAVDGDTQGAEIQRLRKINKTLRRKYQEGNQEIKHLTKEHESGKNELLDIIRMQEKDIKFNERVVQIMLNDNDQYKLRERSTWDEDSREWTVPLFILHKMQDEVAFPTIGAKARVNQARDEREIEFRVDSNGRMVDSARQSRSKSGYNHRDGGANFSDQNGEQDDGIHDPDMQWNKFGSKNNSM